MSLGICLGKEGGKPGVYKTRNIFETQRTLGDTYYALFGRKGTSFSKERL